MGVRGLARCAAGASLIGLGVMHFAWGSGCHWPAKDEADLADMVIGRPELPSRNTCYAAAGALGVAGVLAAGAHKRWRLAAMGRCKISIILLMRGLVPFVPQAGEHIEAVCGGPKRSERYKELDRKYYGPACLVLSALIFIGNVGRRRQALAARRAKREQRESANR